MQTQLFVLDINYCDFVCTHLQLMKNRKFWDDCILRAGLFFRTCILPELLASDNLSVVSYSSDIASNIVTIYGSDQSGPSSSTDVYCNCRAPADSRMIGCDNENYEIEWFHTQFENDT